MIKFMGRLYDATLDNYIDSSPIEYSIATCINTQKLSQLNMVTDSHTITNIFDLADFDGTPGTNVAERIIDRAISIHEHTGEWHELRLFTTNAIDDFALIWRHEAPSNLTIIQNGIYSNFEYAIPWDTYVNNNDNQHSLAYMFTSVSTINELNVNILVWMGSYCLNAITGNVDTYLTYTEALLTVSNSKYYCYDVGTFFGSVGNRRFYKSNNGSALVFWRDYKSGTRLKGPVTIVPFVNNHSDATNTDSPGLAIPGWDGKFSSNINNVTHYNLVDNLWWGRRAEYALDDIYDSNGWPVFSINNTTAEWQQMISTVVEESGILVSERNKELYFYLLGTFAPIEPPSDVDPTDVPPEDDPPIPIPPDNKDPYYDPTSDPKDPTYDPTKDPKDPTYDPTTPHTPYRPPSDVDGGGPAPVQPIPGVIDIPTAPPAFVTNNSLFTLYNPSGGDLNNLANFLWSPTWSLDTLKKIFVNPMDCILGLMVMPQLPADVSSKEMNFGNVPTGITMHFFTKQFCDFDCGTFKLEEFYMSYLDYAPYTKVSIFLPYIGEVELSTDEVMNKTIGVKYRFDISCGACVAFISVDGSILYSFSGNCAAHSPLSANDWGSTVTALAAVPLGAAKIGAMIGGGPVGALGAAAAISVMSMKEKVTHAGTLKGSAGLMGIQTPYLIVNRPRQAAPLNQNSFTGYPSFITESLGSLHGYTEVEQCHLDHIPATHEELVEIERLLKEGVML